jgi:hypothetical protein
MRAHALIILSAIAPAAFSASAEVNQDDSQIDSSVKIAAASKKRSIIEGPLQIRSIIMKSLLRPRSNITSPLLPKASSSP